MNRPMRIAVAITLAVLAAGLPADPQETDTELRRVQTTIDGFTGETPDTQGLAQILGMAPAEDNSVELSLQQIITLALQRNLTLVIQRYQHSRTHQGILENQGIYDFQLDGTFSSLSDTSPTSSELQDTGGADLVFERVGADVSLSQLLPFGGQLKLDWNNSRVESSDRRRNPNPTFSVDVDLTFSLPLLRDFGRDVTEQRLIVARHNVAISREDFQGQVEAVIQQASDGYWDLVESLEQLKVAEESLTLAEDLHGMNRIQVEVGTMAPLEMVASEAGVASRKEDIIRLRALVGDRADILRRLINLEPGPGWDREIVPVTSAEVEHQPIDVGAAVDTALAHRPEMRRKNLLNEILAVDARVAKNQKKPSLGLQATYGFNGLDGRFALRDPFTGEPVLDPGGNPIIFNNGWTDALEQVVDGSFDGWTVGVQFGYPLQNRAARARSIAADLAVEQGDVELRDLEVQILSEVRSAGRALEAAAERIESAKVSSNLNQKNLDAERKRYENGLSTSFQVLQIQEDVSNAKSREVSAVINYRRQETAYYRTIGKLLEKYGVMLSDDVE